MSSISASKTKGAYFLLWALILLWGANWPIMKFGLTFIPPLWFAAARLLMGAITLFLILLIIGRLRLPPRRDLPVLFSVALFQMASFMALVNIAMLHVQAGRSAILSYATPLWVTPGAVFILGERLTWRKLTGLILCIGGVAVLFNPLGFDWHDAGVVKGNALLIIVSFLWAGVILHVRAHRWESSPLELAPWQMLLALSVVAAFAWKLEDIGRIQWSAQLIAVLAYNGPIATAFCFWAAITVTRLLPAITTSLGFIGVPVAGLLFSVVTLGESLTGTLVLGLILIIGGMLFVNVPEP